MGVRMCLCVCAYVYVRGGQSSQIIHSPEGISSVSLHATLEIITKDHCLASHSSRAGDMPLSRT